MSKTTRRRTRGISYRQNNISLIQDTLQLGPVANTVLMIVLVSFVGLMYLSQVTRQNDFSFEVNTLTEQRDELLRQNDALQVQQARLQAVERIESSTAALDLQEPTEIQFIGN